MNNKNGKTEYEEMYQKLAEDKIEKSGYLFLKGFYYFLLTNMAYTSAWDYVYKIIRFLDEEIIFEPNTVTLDNYVKHLASLKNTSSSNKITSYAAMKKFSKYLYANRICRDDYMRYVDRPKYVETKEMVDKRQNGVLTKDQCTSALRKTETEAKCAWMRARDKAIMTVFLSTGIRRAALYKLDISDFDFKNNTINVSEKGDKYRSIYCSDQIMLTIKEWFDYRKNLVDGNETAAFISKMRKRITPVGVSNIVEKYTNKTPHKLRATYITELYDKTHDIYFVQERVNHSSPKTTELYIRGKEKENEKKAAEIVDNFLTY